MTPSLTNAATGDAASAAPPTTIPVTLHINGVVHQLTLDPRATLLDTLRERLGLTGAKKGVRPRRMRRLHGARQWPSHQCLHDTRGHARGSGNHHGRGVGGG